MKVCFLGDIIIILKNPDHESIAKKAITLEEALQIYEKQIEMGTKVKPKKSFLVIHKKKKGRRESAGEKSAEGSLYPFLSGLE